MGRTVLSALILIFRIRWRRVVSFTTRPRYPQRQVSGMYWIGSWVVPRAGLDLSPKKNLPVPTGNRTPKCPSRSLVTVSSYLCYCAFRIICLCSSSWTSDYRVIKSYGGREVCFPAFFNPQTATWGQIWSQPSFFFPITFLVYLTITPTFVTLSR